MEECPYVDHSFTPDPTWNEPVEYSPIGSDEVYIYYRHDDGFGKITNVQFCQICGRVRDVFRCLNKPEWQACPHYQVRKMQVASAPCSICNRDCRTAFPTCLKTQGENT